MSRVAIGVDLDDLRLPVKQAIQRASQLRFEAVEMSAVGGEVSPESLSSTGRRHLSRFVGGLGLQFAALSADIPQTRLADPATAEQRVELTRRIIELAADLRVPLVTAAVGALTDPETGEVSVLAVDALKCIGEAADATGSIYAIRPSCDSADSLAAVLDEVGCPSICIGLDPAAMVMAGNDPMPLIERHADRIVLSHVRDGTVGGFQRSGHETRLGEGEVDLVGVLASLEASGYAGPHIIRRLYGDARAEDIVRARDLLERYLPARG